MMRPSRFSVFWIRKTMRKVTTVVPVLMNSCQYPNSRSKSGNSPENYCRDGEQKGPRGADSVAVRSDIGGTALSWRHSLIGPIADLRSAAGCPMLDGLQWFQSVTCPIFRPSPRLPLAVKMHTSVRFRRQRRPSIDLGSDQVQHLRVGVTVRGTKLPTCELRVYGFRTESSRTHRSSNAQNCGLVARHR